MRNETGRNFNVEIAISDVELNQVGQIEVGSDELVESWMGVSNATRQNVDGRANVDDQWLQPLAEIVQFGPRRTAAIR